MSVLFIGSTSHCQVIFGRTSYVENATRIYYTETEKDLCLLVGHSY